MKGSILPDFRPGRRVNRKVRKAAVILFWMGIWFLLAGAVGSKILLASPGETAEALFALLGKERFYFSVAGSVFRIAAGFLAGFALGVLLAAGSFRFSLLEELLAPVMKLMKTVPVATFAVLLLIWWGPSFLAGAVCLLVVLPNGYISILEGLQGMDRQLPEMAQVFGLPAGTRFFYIYCPALKPFVSGSLKLSLGMCWKAGIAAEVIGIPDRSMGEGLYLAKVYLDTAGVFAWTAVIVLLSMGMEKLTLKLADRFFSWKPACRKPSGGSIFQKSAGKSRREGNQGNRGSLEERGQEGVILEAINVVKSYSGTTVVNSADVCCRPGDIHWLTGPSGCGKTTLLRILAGLTEPSGGRITVPSSCSMVFQEDRLCEGCSAVKNVEMVTGDPGTARQALLRVLDREALDRPCSQLSGGMRRRVALVRAMEADSDYILLDEPFTGMDQDTCSRAGEYVRSRQGNRILIIASHKADSQGFNS